jgi:glycosyltransferase involved in cell wall biosynthesis
MGVKVNPKISIALITYNGEKYIREQLDSIFRQTMQNLEIVVCDDGSTDSTRHILKEYAQNDPRIVLHFNEKNMGYLKNVEKAIKLCRGEYIALADQDDIWEEDHLHILYANIGDNFLICGDTLCVDRENNTLNIRYSQLYKMDINLLKNNEDHLLRLLVMPNIFQGAAMMLKKEFVNIALPFPNNIEYHDWWLALCAMTLNKFVYIPKVVIRHRRHNSNASDDVKFVDDGHFSYKKKYVTMLEKLPNINERSKYIIEQSNLFFINKKRLLNYYKAIGFWGKNYHVLYATDNKDRFLIRLIKSFIYYPFKRVVSLINYNDSIQVYVLSMNLIWILMILRRAL